MNGRTIASALLLSSLALSGCGGDNPTSPTPTSTPPRGVSLTGTFQSASASRAFRSLTTAVDDLVVVVLAEDGSELTRIDVAAGRFTLRGLPEGSFTVQFDDGGTIIGERTFDAVRVNQQITITLDLINGRVEVLEERRNGIGHGDIEIEGLASGIQIEDDPMTGSLTVDGHSVVTRVAETTIRKGNRRLTLDDLRDGDQVHVKGEFESAPGGGSLVFAREIKLQEDDDSERTPTTSSCNVADPAKPGKILICHKGKTLSVGADAWSGHSGHGDTCGPCQ